MDPLQATPANRGLENENPTFQLHSETMLSTDLQAIGGLDGQTVETQVEDLTLNHGALHGRALNRQPVILSSFVRHLSVSSRVDPGGTLDRASIDSNNRRDGLRLRELLLAAEDGSSRAESRSAVIRSRC